MISNRIWSNNRSVQRSGLRYVLIALMVVLAGMMAGCNASDSSDDDDDGDTSNLSWFLASYYFYEYDDDGLLEKEIDDENVNKVADGNDKTYIYEYDENDIMTGYKVYIGLAPPYVYESDWDIEGVYSYDENGCQVGLVETNVDGDERTWVYTNTYTYDAEEDTYICRRQTYTAEDEDGNTEIGTFVRNEDGEVIQLVLDNGDYWDYTLNMDGDRTRYDYYDISDSAGDRYGLYDYYNGRLSRLRNYELQ